MQARSSSIHMRAGSRSRTGCFECRRRRRKCDEKRPRCGQCRRTGSSCSVLDGAFRQHPYTFAFQAPDPIVQGPISDGPSGAESPGSTRKGRFQEESTDSERRRCPSRDLPIFASDLDRPPNPAVASPDRGEQERSAISGESPWQNTISLLSVNGDQNTPGDTFTGPTVSRGNPSDEFRRSDAGLRSSVNDAASVEDADLAVTHPTFNPAPAQQQGTAGPALDHVSYDEVRFLLRYFADCIAPCMDVLSPQQYYRRRVLFLSRENALIRYAACAVAAKQLGHVKRPHQLTEGVWPPFVFTHTTSEGSIDYLWYGAKYYGKAIQEMAAELSCQTSPGAGSSPDQLPWESSLLSPSFISRDGDLASEARLAAAEIMCYYEELSGSWRAWGRHLNGILKFLQPNRQEYQGSASSDLLTQQQDWDNSEASVRSNWHFVFNDFQQSFISESPPRYQGSGKNPLPWSDVQSVAMVGRNESYSAMDVGLRALRTIMRLASTILHAAYSKGRTIAGDVNMTEESRSSWRVLQIKLGRWQEDHASVLSPDIVRRSDAETGLSESWFSDDICALAFVHYHMCRILLMMFSQDSKEISSHHDWLRTHRMLCNEMTDHAREILSVAIGRPSSPLKAKMIQPLYLAGRCLWQRRDQRLVVALLRSVEDELGLASNYRIKALLEEWGTSDLQAFSELDAELSDLSS